MRVALAIVVQILELHANLPVYGEMPDLRAEGERGEVLVVVWQIHGGDQHYGLGIVMQPRHLEDTCVDPAVGDP